MPHLRVLYFTKNSSWILIDWTIPSLEWCHLPLSAQGSLPKSAGKGTWQARSCLWGWKRSLGLQGRTSSNKVPCLNENVRSPNSWHPNHCLHKGGTRGPQFTMPYFLWKLLRQGISLVGLGFIFWKRHKKLHHLEWGLMSFWTCFRKHLK